MFNAKTREEFLPLLQTMESFSAAFRNTSATLWIRAARLLNWISKVVVCGGADLEKAKQNNGQVSAGKSPSPEENAESKSSSDKVPNDFNTKL